MAIFTISIILSSIFYVAVRYITRQQKISKFRRNHDCQPLPHEPLYDGVGIGKALQIISHFRRGTFLEYTDDLFKKYGDTYSTSIFGQSIIFTCNSQNIKHMLSAGFSYYDSSKFRAPLFKPLTEHGIFAVDGTQWKTVRDLFRVQFSNTSSICNLDMLEHHIQKSIRRIPSDGKPIELQGQFIELAANIITSFALGKLIEPSHDKTSFETKKLFQNLRYVEGVIVRDGYLGPLRHLSDRRSFFRACKDIRNYVGSGLSRAYAQQEEQSKQEDEKYRSNYSFAQGLTHYTTDFELACDGITTVLLAGVDAVASLLSATFWLLSRDERVLQKLRKEIANNFGLDIPTREKLRTLRYLPFVFKEVLRCYPPTTLNVRVANKDTVLPTGGGEDGKSSVLVEKGQLIIYSAWSSHHKTEIFGDNPWAFIPERWESLGAEPPGYIPFNAGPRICPGQDFALLEASYITVRILQTFSGIKNHDKSEWKESIGVTLMNRNGVLIGFQ